MIYRFHDFKGFADASLDLGRSPVTVLIGRNGSGKTNLVEGLALSSGLLRGIPLHEVSGLDQGGRIQVRGGLGACQRRGTNCFAVELECPEASPGLRYSFEVGVRGRRADPGPLGVRSEHLSWHKAPILRAAPRGAGLLRVTYRGQVADSEKMRQVNLPGDALVLPRFVTLPGFSPSADLFGAATAFLSWASHLRVFDPQPRAMRGFVPEWQTELSERGDNLAATLYALKRGVTEQQSAFERLGLALRALPEEPFQGLEVIREPKTGQVSFGFRDGSGILVPAVSLSDGLLRALAILTALETIEARSTVVIEELDNGVHPSRVKLLLDACWEIATRRDLNVLVTTHNAATLNALAAERLGAVVVAHRDQQTGQATLTRLQDLRTYPAVIASGLLGDVIAEGALDRYLAAATADEQEVERGLAWIAGLAREAGR